MSQREGLTFSTPIESDAAPLNHLIADVLAAAPHTRCFRDPTRGGLASTLNEFAQASSVLIAVDEEAIPVKPAVRGACGMLGYDVLQVANEGKMVAVVPAEEAEAALAAMRASRYGENAAIIGEIAALPDGSSQPASTTGSVRVRTPWVQRASSTCSWASSSPASAKSTAAKRPKKTGFVAHTTKPVHVGAMLMRGRGKNAPDRALSGNPQAS